MKKALLALVLIATAGCSSAYYAAMEKVGFEKRDILESRVEDARDAQLKSQQEFKDALTQLSQMIGFHGGDLQAKYEALSAQYDESKAAADEVSARINKVETVAFDLFAEWEDELKQYQNAQLRADSRQKLIATKRQFDALVRTMRKAERKMPPVLRALHDNVLYLKHNLNAKAIGALTGEFNGLQSDINNLVRDMDQAIAESNQFIQSIKQN